MNKKNIHTCYGCPYYRPINGSKYPYVTCDIDDVWDCDYFKNVGEPFAFKKGEKHEAETW